MKRTDGSVKSSNIEVIFAPILSLLSMVNNGIDVNDEDLDPNSSNKLEAYLARDKDRIEKDDEKSVETQILQKGSNMQKQERKKWIERQQVNLSLKREDSPEHTDTLQHTEQIVTEEKEQKERT